MPKFDASPQLEPDVQKEVHGDLVESLFDSFGSFAASLVGGVAAPASAWLERYPSMPIQYRIQYHGQDSHIMRSVRRV
jgi:hypothetical protein